MPRIYILHGFLGCKEDWEEVISFLPELECVALEYPFHVPEGAIVVGYSMGGRIALNLPASFRILFSTHPGLLTEEEKRARWKRDLEWIERLKALSLENFLEEWYAQPLFAPLRAHPSFLKVRERRLRQNSHILIEQLTRHSLAHQVYGVPSNTLFVYGEKDIRYKQL